MSENSMPKHLKNILSQLESKLHKNDSGEKYDFHDADLEIYAAAFNDLIRSTVTYSNILSKIKNAYDNALKIRDNRISELMTQDRIYGISANKKQHEEVVKGLVREHEELQERNRDLGLQVARANTELGKLAASHTFDWLCLARERDARYTLFAENVRLQQTVQELDGSDQLDRGGGDPVLLRIALDKCRELLSSTQKELLHMKTEYEDCVPRAEHEQLQAAHDELGVRLHALRHDHEHLQARCNRLEESNASVSEELSEVHARCSELERAGTPRPAWADCADFISGGSHRWWQLSDGLSSKDKLRALLKELGPAAETHSLEFFDGLGTDPSVPPYLRHCGPVRNLRLSRRALSVCVAAIWRAKAEQQDTPMQDYLTAYFEERYQQSSTRAEWAYNVCAAAEQALEDLQVKLFWGALHGVISELVYWGLRAQWDRLRDQLDRHSKDQIITMEQFEKLAKTTFPLKSEVEVRNLAEVVRKQLKLALNNTNINLDKLFHEPEEGFSRSELFAELYRQRRAAQDRYLRELMAALPRASTVPRGPRTGDRLVTVEQLKRAFAVVDPAIDHIRMERHIRWAYSLGAAQPLEAPALPLRTLLTRLAAGDIERAGPRSKPTHRRSHYK